MGHELTHTLFQRYEPEHIDIIQQIAFDLSAEGYDSIAECGSSEPLVLNQGYATRGVYYPENGYDDFWLGMHKYANEVASTLTSLFIYGPTAEPLGRAEKLRAYRPEAMGCAQLIYHDYAKVERKGPGKYAVKHPKGFTRKELAASLSIRIGTYPARLSIDPRIVIHAENYRVPLISHKPYDPARDSSWIKGLAKKEIPVIFRRPEPQADNSDTDQIMNLLSEVEHNLSTSYDNYYVSIHI